MGERISGETIMRNLWIVLIGCLCFAGCKSGDPVLTIEVTSGYPLPEVDTVYITGNQSEFGNWNPRHASLHRNGNSWTGQFAFPAGTSLEFKFTKGSWESEALNDEKRVPGNNMLTLQRDTLVQYHIPFWKDSLLNTAPMISGVYEMHDSFPVRGLEARRVIVWLPPSYATASEKEYPVLYLHDGQNVFDPHTSTLGHDWRIDEIADSLIRKGEIEEFIAVAVYCNPDVRAKEYSDDPDLGEKYQDFLCCQLKPSIDSTYRTKEDAENTAIMGASMGGLISFIMAWEYPDVFSKAACMSPAFKIRRTGIGVDYVEDVQKISSIRDIELYIDNGTLDLEAELQPGIDEMLQTLDARNQEYVWYLDEGAAHNERAWSARAWRPLLQFFGKG
jgi:enterochelin esterase-like enzyme